MPDDGVRPRPRTDTGLTQLIRRAAEQLDAEQKKLETT